MSDYRIKVFSATMVREREALGAEIMKWMRTEHVTIEELIVTQSSDAQFHCLAVTAVYRPGLEVIIHGGKEFARLEIFSVTKARERADLGDRIGELPAGSYDLIVRQSSGAEFHCLTIAVLSGGS